jgi:hypothetical protein
MLDKHVRLRRQSSVADGKVDGDWVNGELAGCTFKDERLGNRFRVLLKQMGANPGGSIPLVCQDWAATKAAYRFLDNDRVEESEILAGHFGATRDRCAATTGPVLVLRDTTEFDYRRDDVAAIGITHNAVIGKFRHGKLRHHTMCGILMHSSLAITTEGLPLGLAAVKFWTRTKFKGTNALKKKINPTQVPIEKKESVRWLENLRQSTALLAEPTRCVHIGDRESDIYELFCAGQDIGTHFLFRTCVDRLAGDGKHTVATEMAETVYKGLHRVKVRDRRGEVSTAVLELKFRKIHLFRLGKYFPNRELWMFCYDKVGAQASANLFSLVMTARANGVEPFEYLSEVFAQLPAATTVEAIEALLPWNLKPILEQRRKSQHSAYSSSTHG